MSGVTGIVPAGSLGDPAQVALGDGVAVEAVVKPASEAEVADVVRWAGSEGATVLPVGTGGHLHRVVTAERAVVTRMSGLSGIRIYEPADLTLTAGAGTPLSELRATLAPHQQWLPFDPPDVDGRTLGGLVASGLSGPLAAGYGALRNHVLGATVVLGDGRVVRLGGRVVKNVAGFDLLRPIVGSMGGLAVISEVCVRLFPVPQEQQLLLVRGDAPGTLVEAARAVGRASVMPASAVVLGGVPEVDDKAALLVRLHGAVSSVQADRRTLQAAMGGPVEVLEGADVVALTAVARDAGTRDRAGGVAVASALPARMGEVLAAVDAAVGTVPLSFDVMGGLARFSFAPEQVTALPGLRRVLEAAGGSLGVERWPPGAASVPEAVSAPRAGEAALAERVRAVFDAPGVYWRGRDAGRAAVAVAPGGDS